MEANQHPGDSVAQSNFLQQIGKTRRRLERLEMEANQHPGDSVAQSNFLQQIGKTHPEIVIQRVESGRFAGNEGVFKEYVKALVNTHRIESASTSDILVPLRGHQVMNTLDATVSGSYGGNAGIGAAAAVSTSENKPLHVQMVDASFKSQMWRTVRFLALAFLLVTIVNNVIDDISLPRGMGLNQEVQPVVGQHKTFDDVKGATEAKEELKEIVSYLRDPHKFTRLGGKLPKGVLLTGPPGTGKTLLAKAIAGEAEVPFFYASGSEFEEMYVGVGARRVRDLFNAAKKHSPCIIFIDEIDAIGSTRALKEQQAMKMTLNQLLVELDGFQETEGVIIIGATNFPDVLDPALVRPGRFDRDVVVPLPDVRDRKEILQLYLNRVPHDENIDTFVIARGTPGASGADLANLVNIAALRASTADQDHVTIKDLEYAKDKILMGAERKSAIIPEVVRRVTAYHEGGHALVAMHTKGAMPVHKATIIPRGPTLGMVLQLPEESDTMQQSKRQMLAEIDVCMGGRVAEELIFGADEITSGASSDLQRATQVARSMVERYGMSSNVGTMYMPDSKNAQLVSNETKQLVDGEVKKILKASYERAKKLLQSHRRELHRLASALLENETLTKEEMKLVIRGKKIESAGSSRVNASASAN
eukprot:CAMPEP_0184075044 /NCGR_PEP_ID=MMETSP0957-20130417/70910_1 /TAXON_ID=627963 /ORGANISM="Aplanochytrium sp, Strain PBS07" /LENGTH=646 /DNA_ID=CAMNT_0026377439 /DNA_START=480 /DNA_END=2420 /DNA_ORIENTATION=-